MTTAWPKSLAPDGPLSATLRRAGPQILNGLHPARLLARALGSDRLDFARAFGDTWMVLVQVQAGSELLRGLAELATDLEPRLAGIPDGSTTTTLRRTNGRADPSPAPLGVSGLHERLARTDLLVLPLRKRAAADRPFPNRVSVGRAGNSDLVLRDDSISRFHGYFATAEAGGFSLVDARSKNGTFLNGAPLTPLEPAVLRAGDEVRFGDVAATLCLPETFWDLVAGGAPLTGRAKKTLTGT